MLTTTTAASRMKPASVVRTCPVCGFQKVEGRTVMIQTRTGIYRTVLRGHCATEAAK